MSRTVVDIDDVALRGAAEELGTRTKVETVNTALREVANRRSRLRLLATLDEFNLDLSPDALRGAWR